MKRWAVLAAGAAACLLAVSTAVAADPTDPKVKTTKADQALASAALLRFSDLGPAWSGHPEKPGSLKIPVCPANQPNDSDLTITGHAESVVSLASAGLQVDTDVMVFRTPAQVATLVGRTLGAKLPQCLTYDLLKQPEITAASIKVGSVQKLPVVKAGDHAGLYRVTLGVPSGKQTVKVFSDFLFVSKGRMQFSVAIVAPSSLKSQLPALESRIAKTLAARAKA